MIEPPSLDWDPYSDEVLADPYPFFAALRDSGPVVWLPKHQIYAVGRYDSVKTVLTDHTRFSTTAGVGLQDSRNPASGARIPNALLEVDPPQHTRVRSVLQRILSPGVIRSWRDGFLVVARDLVDRLVRREEFDGMEDAAEAFIHSVFPGAVGIRFDRAAVKAIGQMSFNQTGPDNELSRSAIAAAQPYLQWFEESAQAENVTSGSLAAKLFEAEAAGELDPGVASSMVRVFVRGGTDSTISGIGLTLLQFARHPEQWENVKAEPARLRSVFDEGIRMESPFHVTCRITTADLDFEGYRLKADRKVAVFPGAANHDPRAWEAPDEFDATQRVAGKQLAFGAGDHTCIGQTFARLEAECLFTAMAERFDAIELAGPPHYHLMNQMRVLGRLPLRVRGVQ